MKIKETVKTAAKVIAATTALTIVAVGGSMATEKILKDGSDLIGLIRPEDVIELRKMHPWSRPKPFNVTKGIWVK